MRTFKYITLLIAMLLSTNIKAQLPSNDSAWVLQTAPSDEFNGTGLDNTKWYLPADSSAGKNAFDLVCHGNVTVGGGHVSIRIDTLTHHKTLLVDTVYKTICYSSGGIIADGGGVFKYGYIEVSAKFPTGHKLYWPAIWFENSVCDVGHQDTAWYNEIDFVENADMVSYNGNQIGSNWHIYSNQPDTCPYDPGVPGRGTENGSTITVCCNLQSAFHTYGLLRDANSMTWYFDGQPIRTVYDPVNVPKHALNAIIGTGLWPYDPPLPHMPKDSLVVDYFHYYKLGVDCSNPLTIHTPTDYHRKVQKSITTNNSSTLNYSPSTTTGSYTLRATDYVLIDAPTGTNAVTINPSGTGYFAIELTPCPN